MEPNSALLTTASCFWYIALNAFVFSFGPSTITLYDLIVLFSVQPNGIKLDPTYEVDTSSFNFIAEFDTFLDMCAKMKDEVDDAKYVAFLLYWLYRHIAYYRSKKIIRVYLGLAVALHKEEKVVMGPFVLCHMYKGLHDVVILEEDESSRTIRDPIWLVQL